MKQLFIILTLLCSSVSFSQGYTFGIVQINDTEFKVIAVPDFQSSGETDASDMGFALTMPSSNATIINEVSHLPERNWSIKKYDSNFLTSKQLNHNGLDIFLFNNPPNQTFIEHDINDEIELLTFQIENIPTSGAIQFLSNEDPIALATNGILDSFYNSNIDNTVTIDYFDGPLIGQESIALNALNTESFELSDNIGVTLHPNPTTDYFMIQTDLAVERVELFDISGKQVYAIEGKSKIDIKKLPNAVYLTKIYFDNKQHITKRVVKE